MTAFALLSVHMVACCVIFFQAATVEFNEACFVQSTVKKEKLETTAHPPAPSPLLKRQ